jgi:CRISPR/Cas system-associated exonuclease Cas4 (RecB family)
MPSSEQPVRLSPSSIGLFKECPRCFWLQIKNKQRRPQGPFPSLPGGMDGVIKKYFDKYRGSLPPELEGKVAGVLIDDLPTLNTWRNWRTGLTYTDTERNAVLSGALDDCLRVGEKYAPLDYKTRGYPPKGDGELFYQHQLDAYSFLLAQNGYPIEQFAYLVYYYPQEVSEDGMVRFNVEPKQVAIDIDRARELFERATDFLRGEEPPAHTYKNQCAFCAWQEGLEEFD